MKNRIALIVLSLLVILALSECNYNKQSKEESTESSGVEGTPVTITTIEDGALTESVELNATSTFLLKSYVKSSTNGYIESSFVQPGQFVPRGAKLFILKTKEAHNLGTTISKMDSAFHFSGRIVIRASGGGYITTLNYRAGDYVADGEQLAVISNLKSFAFLLELPYEFKTCLASNKQIKIKLPDGTVLNGLVASIMPSVDPISQTLSVVIKVNTNKQIPENLIAKVCLVKKTIQNAISLPKEAILTNETQSQFWIMKMINNTTAVKVPVKIGMETNNRVEILSPALSPNDRIIRTGNYGLPDTAKVIISHNAI